MTSQKQPSEKLIIHINHTFEAGFKNLQEDWQGDIQEYIQDCGSNRPWINQDHKFVYERCKLESTGEYEEVEMSDQDLDFFGIKKIHPINMEYFTAYYLEGYSEEGDRLYMHDSDEDTINIYPACDLRRVIKHL